MKRVIDAFKALSQEENAIYDGSAKATEVIADEALQARTRNEMQSAAASMSTRDTARLRKDVCSDMVGEIKSHTSWQRGLQHAGPGTALKAECVNVQMPETQLVSECRSIAGKYLPTTIGSSRTLRRQSRRFFDI